MTIKINIESSVNSSNSVEAGRAVIVAKALAEVVISKVNPTYPKEIFFQDQCHLSCIVMKYLKNNKLIILNEEVPLELSKL